MQPAAEPEAEEPPAPSQSRQCDHERCGRETEAAEDREPDAHSERVARKDGSGQSERSQRHGVDQPEHRKREAECLDPRRTVPEAADDGDPDDVVEPSGKREARDRCASVRSRERERLRTLMLREELPPPVGLERVPENGESSCRGQETGVAARERQWNLCEVPGCQEREDNGHKPRSHGDDEPAAPRSPEVRNAVRGRRPAEAVKGRVYRHVSSGTSRAKV